MTIEELQNLTDSQYKVFNWTSYLQNVFSEAINSTRYLSPQTVVVVSEVDYMINLTKLIMKEDPTTIQNYVIWRAIMPLLDNMNRKTREIYFEYIRVMDGVSSPESLWRTCLSQMLGTSGFALGLPYVKRYFPQEIKAEVTRMIDNLKSAFKKMLQKNSWMKGSKAVVKVALEKVNAMKVKIGYPDWIYDNAKLDHYYRDVKGINRSDSLNNILILAQAGTTRRYRSIIEPVDNNRWHFSPATVNAAYDPNRNSIEFPAAILQPPFYYAKGPKAYNYGSLGAIIGHEITHGFDDQGRLYDKKGFLTKWWDNRTESEFERLSECYVKQYNEFCPEVLNTADEGNVTCINGRQTLGENIADNGGLKESYLAYKRWEGIFNGHEVMPVGLRQITSDQLFFYGFAQNWCSSLRVEGLRDLIESDYHSPYSYRLIGSVMNMPEFSNAFNCSSGKPMNSGKDACTLW